MDKKEIAQLKLNNTKPTTLNLKLLQEWVVWQFPKKIANGFCGAVHPPLKEHGWFPAIIRPEKNEAQVHGHVAETFASPELAAEYVAANHQSK
ncbi:MAG: hypothetical protein CL608_22745 [Anaerolineaceae bacterium]|nr:hypothetical protein [Anaerolineaceae bacterium]